MASLALAFDILARDRGASKTFKDVGDAAERAGKKGGGFGKVMSGGMALAGKAVVAGGAAVATGIGVSIKKAMDFDKTMRTVGATLGASGPVQKQLTALALKLGKETAFSAADASDAMLELAKGGMTAVQIKSGALSSTLTLASAGGLALGDAATYMSNALNTFRLPAKDAGKVAAALAGAANASTASVESMGLALSQVGPGAKTAGLSLQTTTAILAAFDNAGIKGTDAGTSLKTMLTRLVPSTKAARNAMHDLGLKFTDAHGTFLPMTEIAQQLQDKLKGLSDEQRTTALATIFGSDATRAATVLADLGAKGVAKYTKATSDQGAAQRMAKTATEGASGAWESFQGTIETIAITLGEKLLPMFTGVVKGANNIASVVLDSIGPAFETVQVAVDDFIAGITLMDPESIGAPLEGMVAVGQRVRVVFVRIMDAVKNLVREWQTGEGAGGKLRAILSNLVTVGGYVGEVFGQIAGSVADFVSEFQRGEGAGGAFRTALSKLGDVVKNVTGWLAENKTVVQSVVVAVMAGFAAFKVITTAVKAYTAAQVILNAVLDANPIGIVIVAIAGLTAGLIYAYQHSQTFRTLVNLAFQKVKEAALNLAGVAIGAFQKLLNFWFIVVGGILDGAAKAFGWVPGVGPKLQGAAREFGKFRDSANAKMDAIQKSIQLSVNAKPANAAMTAFYKKWTGKTLQIKANAYADVGNYRGGGSGGGFGGSVLRPVNAPIGTGFNGYPGHKGIDFPVPVGTPVRAAMSGMVVRAGHDPGGFGTHLRTIDDDGNMTIYGHLSRLVAHVGQRLTRGVLAAFSGNTGHTTGPHLHLERRHPPFGINNAWNFAGQLSGVTARANSRSALLFDQGGILPMGPSVVVNNTGKPEPLARVDQQSSGFGQRMHPHDLAALIAGFRESRPVAEISFRSLDRGLVAGLP